MSVARPGRCLLDTGPVVALLNADDRDHERSRTWLAGQTAMLVTSEAVLTEATHLLGRDPRAQRDVLTLATSGAVQVAALSAPELRRCRELMERYEDVPMDFADATLVVLAEGLGIREVATLDRRGFGAYRLRGGRALRILPD